MTVTSCIRQKEFRAVKNNNQQNDTEQNDNQMSKIHHNGIRNYGIPKNDMQQIDIRQNSKYIDTVTFGQTVNKQRYYSA